MSRSLYSHDTLDADTLAKAAREALTRPSDSAWFDERLFDTHGCVYTWADRSDDVLDESNFHTMLTELEGIAASEDNDCESDDVMDVSASHWAVGSVRHIFVRVYDESGDITPVFAEAARMALYIRDEYPILDESDYSEREWKAYEEDQDNALDQVVRTHGDDSAEDVEKITERFYSAVSDGRFDTYLGSEGADWDVVAEGYNAVRDEYFDEQAAEFAEGYQPSDVPTVDPNQGTLDL